MYPHLGDLEEMREGFFITRMGALFSGVSPNRIRPAEVKAY
jgi:hypothetical protein